METITSKKDERRLRQLIYNLLEIEDMCSEKNKYFAGQKLGHRPNDEEARLYYAQHGAPKFNQKFNFILDEKYELHQIINYLIKQGYKKIFFQLITGQQNLSS